MHGSSPRMRDRYNEQTGVESDTSMQVSFDSEAALNLAVETLITASVTAVATYYVNRNILESSR